MLADPAMKRAAWGHVGAICLPAALAACAGDTSTLDPAGPRAAAAIDLHWIMFWMAAVVMALVLGLLGWALVRRGREEDRFQGGIALVVLGGIVLPLAMLPVVWAITIGTMAAEAAPDGELVATIEVTGYQWAYEVRCEGEDETSVNEIHIPVGEPVLLRVTSADVVHSLWIPRLAGKQDMVPGEVHDLWLEASEPGVYVGQCAEFCGEHHADHTLTVLAGDAGDCGGSGAAAAGSCCG